MNERIRELAKQAGLPIIDGEWDYNDREILCQVDGEWRVAAPSEIISVLFDCEKGREKFAELIVRECANIAREVGTSTNTEDFALDRCYEIEAKIEQHFGIKE